MIDFMNEFRKILGRCVMSSKEEKMRDFFFLFFFFFHLFCSSSKPTSTTSPSVVTQPDFLQHVEKKVEIFINEF